MKSLRWLAVLAVVGLVAGFGWYRWEYPYGRHPCCSTVLGMALVAYAERHEGKFPTAEREGELGLGRLLQDEPEMVDLVVGKGGDAEAAVAFFAANGWLKPEHSNWAYREGARLGDNGGPIAWDRESTVRHHGARTRRGEREVILPDGSTKEILGADWVEPAP